MENVRSIELESSGWFSWVSCILGWIMLVVAETACIAVFFKYDLANSLLILFIFQIPAFLCYAMGVVGYRQIKNKTKFTLYAMEIKKGTDIEQLRENYYICCIDAYGVAFVEKDDFNAFDDYNMARDIKYRDVVEYMDKMEQSCQRR